MRKAYGVAANKSHRPGRPLSSCDAFSSDKLDENALDEAAPCRRSSVIRANFIRASASSLSTEGGTPAVWGQPLISRR